MTDNEKRVLGAYREAEDDLRETLNKFNERKAIHGVDARFQPNLKAVGQVIQANNYLKAALKSLDSI